MVIFDSDVISLTDGPLTVTLDSAMLPNLEFDNAMLAMVKLGDVASYFVTVRLTTWSQGGGKRCSWQVNAVVESSPSHLAVTACGDSTRSGGGDGNYVTTNVHPVPLLLSPGRSQRIAQDIVLRLLLRSSPYDPQSNPPRDPPCPARYHVLSLYERDSVSEEEDNDDDESVTGTEDNDDDESVTGTEDNDDCESVTGTDGTRDRGPDTFGLMRGKHARCFLRPRRPAVGTSGGAAQRRSRVQRWFSRVGAGVWTALVSHFHT